MRKGLQNVVNENNNYKIIAVDDEEGIVDSLSIFLKRSGYDFTGVTDPMEAIEKVKTELTGLRGYIEKEEYSEAVPELDKSVYILEHIKDKTALNLKNIF